MSNVQMEMVSTHLDEEVEFKETSRVEIKKKNLWSPTRGLDDLSKRGNFSREQLLRQPWTFLRECHL